MILGDNYIKLNTLAVGEYKLHTVIKDYRFTEEKDYGTYLIKAEAQQAIDAYEVNMSDHNDWSIRTDTYKVYIGEKGEKKASIKSQPISVNM